MCLMDTKLNSASMANTQNNTKDLEMETKIRIRIDFLGKISIITEKYIKNSSVSLCKHHFFLDISLCPDAI